MIRFISLFMCCSLALLMTLVSCSENPASSSGDEDTTISEVDTTTRTEPDDFTWDPASEITVTLNGSGAISASGLVQIQGGIILLTKAGAYRFTGTLTDGQIQINCDDSGKVVLIFDQVSLASSANSPVYCRKAEKLVIFLPEGTTNSLVDASTYIYDNVASQEPNATLFSKSDLILFGKGLLSVTGRFNDGIVSKDGLNIHSGSITVQAKNDGIQGKDYVSLSGGTISVSAGGDGIKGQNEDDLSSGFIKSESASVTVTAGGDGLVSQSDIRILSGTLSITTGGGSSKTVASSLSAKGIKAGYHLILEGGSVQVNSADDGLHSNQDLTLKNGTVSVSSGDDGIHAEKNILISGGTLMVSKSVEGIEGGKITIDDGIITVYSSDDGINATYGTGGESADGSLFSMTGGSLVISSATGDGLDSNGDVQISDGLVIVHGPQSNPEVGLDYNGTCVKTGGTVIISGTNSNMTQAPGSVSTQYSLKLILTSAKTAGTLFHIEDTDGNSVVTFKPLRSYYSIVYSSPQLQKGSTYRVFTGGTSTGSDYGGFLTGGTYSGGTLYTTFTVSSTVTSIGSGGKP